MTRVAARSAPQAAILRGVGFGLASYACFSTADAIIKLASGRFPVAQIACMLAFFAFGPILFLARGQGGLRALVPQRWGLVLLRGGLTSLCAILCWSAFARMPLADGYAILFAAPMLVTVLAIPFLKEQVGWRRLASCAVGFLGVLLMIRPDFATIGVGHAEAAAAAVLSACSMIVLRKAGARERSSAILAALFGILFLITLPFALAAFVAPSPKELLMLAMAGLLQGCGQAGLVLATRESPVAVVAPFQYSQMLWAVLFGVVIFGDRPTPILFLGLLIVVGSGLYTLWREAVLQRPTTVGLRGEAPAQAARAQGLR